MCGPQILQLIRLQPAAYGDLGDLKASAGIGADELSRHVMRLFLGGELEADCEVAANGLQLKVDGLSPCGRTAMLRERLRRGSRDV